MATSAGNDVIRGGTAGDLLVGDNWADNSLRAGTDQLVGRAGDDTLFGDNVDFDQAMTVGSAGGRDLLSGDAGSDTLRAGPGNDVLNGGPDSDTCDGEAGTGDLALACEAVTRVP
ncbi:hypothetical protein NC490_64980 [Streptomyces sp. G1]|nr:hypothetical protein [Streptomyces sp. G1]